MKEVIFIYNFYGNNFFRLERKGHVDPDALCDEIENGIDGTNLPLNSKETGGVLDLTVKSKASRHWIILEGDQKAINGFIKSYRILN